MYFQEEVEENKVSTIAITSLVDFLFHHQTGEIRENLFFLSKKKRHERTSEKTREREREKSYCLEKRRLIEKSTADDNE